VTVFHESLAAGARRALGAADAAANRLYGSALNPLYHSGAVVVLLLGVLIASGIYLTVFYRLGAPYDSVAGLTGQVWAGRWIRSLHRYAADAAVAAAALHAVRLFAQRRSWGPRALAWISGVFLLFLVLVCGWTGYVMIWDAPGQLLAIEGARILDVLPIFGEPVGRAFVGERPLPTAFFFLNLFLHLALPIGLALVLWVHVSRVARPQLLPPRALSAWIVGLLTALSVLWPIGMAARADLLRLPGRVPLDAFYAFWLPLARAVPPWAVWTAGGALALALLLVPLWSRPRPERPAPSVVNERLCTGCEQCYLDCPYEAISMHARADGRAELVALVDPSRCVSCGICAGSCAPMGVGPPGRTGRDQLANARAFLAERRPGPADVVVIACDRGAGGAAGRPMDGAPVFAVACAGSLHTSVVELFIRSGVRGVLVATCPPRDCWNREGVAWLDERLYHEREAELQERVDRRRLRVVSASAGESREVLQALRSFHAELGALEGATAEAVVDLEAECETAPSAEEA
jgi:ferredoxin